jgi:superfamily II DNA or RNA helicase
MASLLSQLAAKVTAAAPVVANAPKASLSSLVAAVQRAAPAPKSARRAMRPTTPIVLVSCSDTKIETHGQLVAAADLYASPLFRKSLAYARSITSEDRIRILSARHGLLRTMDKITSYDFAIQQLSERERDAFGERVHDELGRQFGREPQELTILAGAEYISALRGITNRFRKDRLPWSVSLPFGSKKGARMSIGERLQWLNAQALERGAATAVASPRARGKSLASLTAAVVAAGSPVKAAKSAARPATGVAAPPRTSTTSLASLTAAVLAAVPASSTRPVKATPSVARPPAGVATSRPTAATPQVPSPDAIIAVAPSPPAPASTRPGAPSVRAGTRISFLGDAANGPSEGAITSVDGAYFWGRLDNGRTLVRQPIALLSTPKWRVLVGAQATSARAPASLKIEDLDNGWDSPPTQRAVPVSPAPAQLSPADARSPRSVGSWRADLARHEEAESVVARQARLAQTAEWLEDATRNQRTARGGVEHAKAARELDDAKALHRAASLRELDPLRLTRLVEATRGSKEYESLHAALLDAEERGAYGVRSTQVALLPVAQATADLVEQRAEVPSERLAAAPASVRREETEHAAAAPPHPVIDSAAALRRIPVGTKLRLVQSLRGPENSGRIFHQARSADVAFLIDDPSKKNHGQISYLQLKGSRIERRPNGFAVIDGGRVMAQYVFADAAASDDDARSDDSLKTIEGADPVEAAPSLVEVLSPIEHRTASARRDANIKAMWLAADLEAHPRPLADEDRLILAAYSDWGGIGLQKSLDKFPPGFDIPDTRQLIHAYFTPPAICAEIARLVQPLLGGLVATDGRVHALEPAVGIGRFPLALSGRGFESVTWHCVEFSRLSYKMFHALRPDIDLYQGPFEGWVAEHGADFAGRLKLVISNPPYGQRSYATTQDPDRRYRTKRADHYFLRRGLDLLGAGGLGIYIIPSGFLTGMTEDAVALRAEVLRSHHLAVAFRLPNEVFSLANVVTDILFFRARGGSLAEVDEADKFILEGRYYEELPTHILGTVVPNEPGKRGWHTSAEGYTVTGEFTSLPPVLDERPMCAACLHTPAPDTAPPPNAAPGTATKATAAERIIDTDDRMAAVSALGHRVESFLASVANPDLEPVGWEELHHDLTQWTSVNGAPAQDKAVIALAKAERGPLGKGPPGGAGWLLKAFLGKSSTLIASLSEKPRWAPRFVGNPNDPLQVGEHLYRSRKTLTIDELPGKDPSALFAAGWCEDSTSAAWIKRLDVRGELLPPDEYLFGELWPRFDRAQARAALGDAQAAAQAARLIEIIKPATFDEIEVTPQDGFVPIELLAAWLTTMNYRDAVKLVREKGLVHLADVAYEDHDKSLNSLSTEALLILGWVNHDYVIFQPHAADGEKVDDVRLALAKDWTQRFRAWLDADAARQREIEHHYQRARQGYRAHGYGSEPLKLARWNPAIVLNPHQIAGARRIDANRGGGLGFDVGVGKTFTITASLALARQAGRARRAVIVVPQPIAFQWVANLGKSLPDFRVVVIGINQKTIAHGLRKGVETSETDSPEERSRKWARFQGGEFDVAILTYDALPRTQMDKESTLRFIEGVTAIEREVELRRRNAVKASKGALKKYEEEKGKLERKIEKAVAAEELKRRWPSAKSKGDPVQLRAQLEALEKKHLGSLTERQDAVLTEGVGAWLAEMLELPASWKHDPDIVWNTIGVDWMAFDEGHNGKNLHMPSSREGGSVPKFMGNEGEGSKRAWHWFFRCCDVQSRGGEVIVATATPASNSPVEFYNLVKLMDKEAWSRIGIHDPEAFIDRFCLLEPQEVLNAEMEAETRLACVGFKNLDELRSVIFKFWEFKTAKQAKLKLPVAKVDRVFVNMDAAQEKKYESYIAEIETALSNPREGSHKILGLLAKMAMVAMHSQLDEKFGWKDAGLVASPHSPKFDALAQKILAQRGCGHIVFADYIAAHAWIRDVLIEAGIPAGRIGILNAVVAPAAADRQRIARDFNGDAQAGIASKYDVLIANAIGEEGVDLQDKTCAIHHMDIGWTPKKTEQRNGRGVRQGNTLSNINIFYYIANRSQDGTRLDMVRGKQNWISSLLEGEDKDTNNPAAQSTLSRKELLVLISRDPEKTRLRLEAAEAEREEQRKAKVAKAASDSLRAVANRFERARTERDPTIAAEYLSVARQKLAGLAKVPPEIWPWAGWAVAAEQSPMLVPKEGGPVFEGLRVAMPRVLDHSVIEYAEFGRIDGATLGTRVAGAAHWEAIGLDQVTQLHLEPQMRIAEGSGPSWPSDDKASVDKAMSEKWIPRFRHGAGVVDAWRALGWMRAPDQFVEAQWARWGDEIVQAMASTGGWAASLQVPAIRSSQLVLGLTPPYSAVLPPTIAGWHRFLELAPGAGEKFTVLEEAGLWWFGRRIPRNLLAAESAPQSVAA